MVGRRVLGEEPEVVTDHLTDPAIVAVFDGLGGHPAGDVASQLAADRIATASVPEDEATLVALLEGADRALHRAGAADLRRAGMGTTAAVLVLRDDTGWVANVGDSSIYRVTDAGLAELTVSDRAFGSTILQCLGAAEDAIRPHVKQVPLAPGERLLLASDGLTDVVSEADIVAALREDPVHAVERLVHAAACAGFPDDVTVVLVDLVDQHRTSARPR